MIQEDLTEFNDAGDISENLIEGLSQLSKLANFVSENSEMVEAGISFIKSVSGVCLYLYFLISKTDWNFLRHLDTSYCTGNCDADHHSIYCTFTALWLYNRSIIIDELLP